MPVTDQITEIAPCLPPPQFLGYHLIPLYQGTKNARYPRLAINLAQTKPSSKVRDIDMKPSCKETVEKCIAAFQSQKRKEKNYVIKIPLKYFARRDG